MRQSIKATMLVAAVFGSGIGAAGTASATTVLGGGSPLAAGSSFAAPLEAATEYPLGVATFAGPSGAVRCKGGVLGGAVGSNPNSSAVSLTATAFGFGPMVPGEICADTLAASNVISVQLQLPAAASLGFTRVGVTGGTLELSGLALRVSFLANGVPGTCLVVPNTTGMSAQGAVLNADGSVDFESVPVRAATPSICNPFNPTTAFDSTFSAHFGPATAGGGALNLG